MPQPVSARTSSSPSFPKSRSELMSEGKPFGAGTSCGGHRADASATGFHHRCAVPIATHNPNPDANPTGECPLQFPGIYGLGDTSVVHRGAMHRGAMHRGAVHNGCHLWGDPHAALCFVLLCIFMASGRPSSSPRFQP